MHELNSSNDGSVNHNICGALVRLRSRGVSQCQTLRLTPIHGFLRPPMQRFNALTVQSFNVREGIPRY
jgi:hypothetical protein